MWLAYWTVPLYDKKLSVNKLSNNNLASELGENKSFLNQWQSKKLLIFYFFNL